MTANERTDDSSDESIVFPKFAERTVLRGIGKMTKIDKVTDSTSRAEDHAGSTEFHFLPHVDTAENRP